MNSWEENITCPVCEHSPERGVTKVEEWDFIDGETHKIKCPQCKRHYIVTIERPIEVMVTEGDKP